MSTVQLTPHPHAMLILEKARQDAAGETAAEWWGWHYYGKKSEAWLIVGNPSFERGYQFRYTMTNKHPDFVPPKSKPRLVNMSALPVGSVVSGAGYFENATVVGHYPGHLRLLNLEHNELRMDNPSYLRIAEQKEFTYWGGGECPMPEGLLVEAVFRADGPRNIAAAIVYGWKHDQGGADIIAYRITGLDDGWTDNPEDAS